jgi:hypothetical protein
LLGIDRRLSAVTGVPSKCSSPQLREPLRRSFASARKVAAVLDAAQHK